MAEGDGNKVIRWTIAGVLITVVFGLVAFTGYTLKDDILGSSDPTPPPSSSSTSTTSSTTTSSPPTTSSSTTTSPSPTIEDDDPVIPPGTLAGDVASFSVTFAPAPAVPVGRQVGPDLWQLNDDGQAAISVAWTAKDADGVPIDTDTCQILLTVEGPQDLDAYRSANCAQDHRSGFSSDNTIQDIRTPGTYTATVTDQLTNASGSATFQVIR